MWCHAGIWRFSTFDSFLGARVRLCFFAVCSSAVSGRGVCFPDLFGLPEGWSVVRKVCMLLGFVIPALLMQFIIVSMAYVQVGHCRDLSM